MRPAALCWWAGQDAEHRLVAHLQAQVRRLGGAAQDEQSLLRTQRQRAPGNSVLREMSTGMTRTSRQGGAPERDVTARPLESTSSPSLSMWMYATCMRSAQSYQCKSARKAIEHDHHVVAKA